MVGRLIVDFDAEGRVSVSEWRSGEAFPALVGTPQQLAWPLDVDTLCDLRWYLEHYLRAPFGVYGERGPRIADQLPAWGARVFEALFASGPPREAYVRARARGGQLEVVLRSSVASVLGLPWELMADPSCSAPLALDGVSVTRSLPSAELGEVFTVRGERLRALMVISRPRGAEDVSYQMIARPLLRRLEAVRGAVELVVLRPPTLERLGEVLQEARAAGEPFQIVHFDGHGVFTVPGGPVPAGEPLTFQGPGPRGMLHFEKPGGGADQVPAERVAQVLAQAQVPVVVLNACQSGMIGSQVEAAVATRLLQAGAGAVVAMAYSVYAVAASEFMAAFYERLFAGDQVAEAVTAGRQRLAQQDRRPSPKGMLPLADWMVPVLYKRSEVAFPGLRTERAAGESLDAILDRIREQSENSDADKRHPDERLASEGEFVGRDGLLYTLDIAARLQRVVVLHGPGGTGKTELAKAFGRWCRDSGAVDKPDWVFWHSFEPGLATFGLDGVVNVVGQQVFGTRFSRLDPQQRHAAVEEALATRRLLLIWDNFESAHTMPDPSGATPPLAEEERDALRAFLQRVMQKGRSSVVVTSRTPETWLGDVRRIEVPGLELEEATAYAEQLLAPYPNAGRRREQRAFGELMQTLDGHPLSMRLVLPHLDRHDPQELLNGLQRGEASLLGRADGARSTSLFASITYSFTYLPAADQQALIALSLFHDVVLSDVLGVFSRVPTVPEHFRERTAEEWEQLLQRTASIGLLTELAEGVYRIHPALPPYLTAMWRRHDPDRYADQYGAALLALLHAQVTFCRWVYAQLKSGNTALAFALIHVQRRTLGSMLGYALNQGLWALAESLVRPLNDYWEGQGLIQEVRGWVDRARLALEDIDGNPPSLDTTAGSLWLLLVGREAHQQVLARQLSQAERTYQEIHHALQSYPATTWQRGRLATVYSQLGLVAQLRGKFRKSEEWYQSSLSIREDLGDRSGMASSYHQLGLVAQDEKRLEDAEKWHQRCLAIEKELKDRQGMASSYHELGIVAHERGEFEDSERWCQSALAIDEELQDRPGMASSYQQLGMLAQGRGNFEDAERWYLSSLAIWEELGDQPGMARIYHELGMLARHRKLLEEAEEWYGRSLAIRERLEDLPSMAAIYRQFVILAETRGRPLESLTWTIKCLACFEEFPHPATAQVLDFLKHSSSLLGVQALEQTWRTVTGETLPDVVRAYALSEL
ncbi:tetratricopeptide repeat protein [Streptomyces sp. NPDC002690]